MARAKTLIIEIKFNGEIVEHIEFQGKKNFRDEMIKVHQKIMNNYEFDKVAVRHQEIGAKGWGVYKPLSKGFEILYGDEGKNFWDSI